MIIPAENKPLLLLVLRHRLALLVLIYQFLAWLFWLGVLTLASMLILLLHESAAVTSQILTVQ